MEKPPTVTERKMKRRWSELNVEKFFQDLDLSNLTVDSEDLAEYMDKYNKRITFQSRQSDTIKGKYDIKGKLSAMI